MQDGPQGVCPCELSHQGPSSCKVGKQYNNKHTCPKRLLVYYTIPPRLTYLFIPTGVKTYPSGFPGGAVVGSLPASAGDMGSSPGLGGSRVPRSGWAREPQLLSLRVWSLCSATREAAMVKRPAHRDEEWPPLAITGESPRTEAGTQHSHK